VQKQVVCEERKKYQQDITPFCKSRLKKNQTSKYQTQKQNR